MIKNCITLFQKEQEEKLYKNYVTRCLRMITENTANMSQGRYIKAEFEDVIKPRPVDNRTADEIIGGIKEKIKKLNS